MASRFDRPARPRWDAEKAPDEPPAVHNVTADLGTGRARQLLEAARAELAANPELAESIEIPPDPAARPEEESRYLSKKRRALARQASLAYLERPKPPA